MIHVIYLDYSATTPVDKGVLESFQIVTQNYIGNPNSLHKLGVEAKRLIDASSKQIADILKVKPSEIIYTSGASESNNTVIKGIAFKYQNRGKHIITTQLEHSSVLEPLHSLEQLGFEISYAKLDEFGRVDLQELEKIIRDDTILVSIASVNSEVGVIQDIEKIGKLLKNYPKLFFHSDMTQSIGKEKINLQYVDFVSMSAQKFYGMKGSGLLYKKESIEIEPLIHGGKSTTSYRSGTPAPNQIVCLAKALRLAYQDYEQKQGHVKEIHDYLIEKLNNIEGVHINSNSYCLPHIINISIPGIKPETMLHALEEEEIYISTQTACSNNKAYSLAVLAITNNEQYASSSMRISISHLTTQDEITTFVKTFKQKISYLKELER